MCSLTQHQCVLCRGGTFSFGVVNSRFLSTATERECCNNGVACL